MEKQYYVGIDLGGTTIKLGIINREGTIMSKQQVPTPKGNYHGTLALIKSMIDKTDIPKKSFIGVGIGVPGFINIDKGYIKRLVNVGWSNVYLKSDFEELMGLPVYIDNDANIAAYGEMWKGAGKRAKNLILVTVGTGIGAGIIIDGKIYRGNNSMAGEVGHITINPHSDKVCNCGKKGCLETESSASAMLEEMERVGNIEILPSNHRITLKQIFDAAVTGNKEAEKAIDQACYYLGLALSQISHALAPEKIILGGGVSNAGDQFILPVKKYFERFSLDLISQETELALATLGNDAGIIGAAKLVEQNYLDNE